MEQMTALIEPSPLKKMVYHRHHKACTGYCGYCNQLRRKGVDPALEGKKVEVLFAWDEANVLL